MLSSFRPLHVRGLRHVVLLGVLVALLVPVVTQAVTASNFDLLTSSSPSRDSGVTLSGAQLSGSKYVFLTPAKGVTRASFWLDNPTMSGAPTQIERYAPIDFAGTASNGSARPWDTNAVADGTHSITVAVTTSSATTVLTAVFTVTNNGAAPRPTAQPTANPTATLTKTLPTAPTPKPTATPTPTVGSTPSPTAPTIPRSGGGAGTACLAGAAFLKTQGTAITCQGEPVLLTGYTFYPSPVGGTAAWHRSNFKAYIDHILDMGVASGQNLIRPTDQWDKANTSQTMTDPVMWANMDYLMTAARARGVFVILDLSAYKWLLTSQGRNPMDASLWTPFINFVAARYANNPAIAFTSIVGEPTPPKTTADLQSMLSFYRSVSDAVRAADHNHLITVGGFNHMEDSPSLGWWQAIDALPSNDIVGVKTYSQHDLDLIPTIGTYSRSVNKPVVDEEFGMPQSSGDATFSGVVYNRLSMSRSTFFDDVYRLGKANGFYGFVFWNMGCQIKSTSYEISPKTPGVWSMVVQYGANPMSASAATTAALCP